MGEDVGRYGGCFAVSKGLLQEFGPERIRNTPLSESVFVGAGIGQSSWGPTGFGLLPSAQREQLVLDAAGAAGVVDPALTLRIAEPLNRGARVIEHPPRRADAAAAQESSARHGSDEAKVDHWPPPQRSHAPARSPQLGR